MSQMNYGVCDVSNNRGNWNHVQIIPKTFRPYRLTRKARHLGTTQYIKIGHCTHTSGSANVTVKGHSAWEITVHVSQIVTTD